MNAEAVRVLWVVACLATLMLVAFRYYPEYRVAYCRQRLFELRNELFLLAADGGITFDHPAYGTLRDTMNGLLRFCHRLSLLEVILYMRLLRKTNLPDRSAGSFEARWTEVSQGLPPQVQERLEDIRRRTNLVIAEHCIHMSPFFVFFLVGLVLLRGLSQRLIRALGRRIGDRVEAAALAWA